MICPVASTLLSQDSRTIQGFDNTPATEAAELAIMEAVEIVMKALLRDMNSFALADGSIVLYPKVALLLGQENKSLNSLKELGQDLPLQLLGLIQEASVKIPSETLKSLVS